MSFRFLSCLLVAVMWAGPLLGEEKQLRVCADPANMPFSNRKEEGFENRIAELVARDLNAQLTYIWQRMGRGFVREYINNGVCDLLIGVPAGLRPVLTTTPYYRSTYVFVTRQSQQLQPASLDDPALRRLHRIGVQVLDEDYTPPGEALARRGMQSAVVGFQTTGDDAGSIIRAVADREVDASLVWGPLAGYFAKKYRNAIQLRPVLPEVDPPALPLTFSISMGVRKGNTRLRDELEGVLVKERGSIHRILLSYGVPMLEAGSQEPKE